MRLWHKDLITALPRKQLLGQWRECCLIAKALRDKGTPNHIIVNRVTKYPVEHFVTYTSIVWEECTSRGYTLNWHTFARYFDDANASNAAAVSGKELFEGWHNERYFWQCYYNLQEKYDCGGISESEWRTVNNALKGVK